MKIHYHSDCPFFAGCEKMLVNFMTSDVLRGRYRVSFSYRMSSQYAEGVSRHMPPDFPIFPLVLAPEEWLVRHVFKPATMMSRGIQFVCKLVTRIPFFLYDVWEMYRLIKRVDPDIVHLNNGGFPGARSVRAAAIGAKFAGCRSILMVVNNMAFGYCTPGRYVDYLFDRWVVRSVTKFVTGSLAASNRLVSVLSLHSNQVQPIPNGISLCETSMSKDDMRRRLNLAEDFAGIVIGVVAVMEPRKGHAVLLDAVEALFKKDAQLRDKVVVWLEGDGTRKNHLKDLVTKKGLGHLVHFIGTESNVIDLLNAIDVLVLPSIDHEDFPNVTLEAMALGKAVIASAIAGIPEQIVDGTTGYLVEPGNPDALALAISSLIDDRDQIKWLGTNGQTRFKEYFTAEEAVRKYLDLYESMLLSSNVA